MYKSIKKLLGGEKWIKLPLQNDFDLIKLTKKGIPYGSLLSVRDYMDVSLKVMAYITGTTERTLQRKKVSERLSAKISEPTIELAKLLSKGEEVFGNKQSFLQWLNLPVIALNSKKPLDILDTSFGKELVYVELVRMAHGVYS